MEDRSLVPIQISLTERERGLLDAEADRTGRSIPELIRHAVEVAYGHQRLVDADLAAMRSAFGAWGSDRSDGASYAQARRSGRRLQRPGAATDAPY